MEVKVKYANLTERQAKVSEQEAKGLRMLTDDFDADWEPGDEPHGTMTFTDVIPPSPVVEPVRDLAAEIDQIKADIATIQEKLKVV